MTLLFMDGFDHYLNDAEMLRKWDEVTSSVDTGTSWARFTGTGKQGCRIPAGDQYAIKYLPVNAGTIIFGCGFRKGETGTITYRTDRPPISLMDGTTLQIGIHLNASQNIVVTRGTTTLATSALSVADLVWYHLEVKVVIHDSAGSVLLKMDGTDWIDVSGVDTQNSGNAYVNRIKIAGFTIKDTNFDDLYVCDNQGTVNNDFLGDSKIATLRPNGAGNHTDFTPLAGANYENVDDLTDIDDDATYNSHDTVGEKDSYVLDDLPAIIGAIYGVQLCTTMKKDDAGTRTAKHFLRTNSTDYPQGSAVSLATSYAMERTLAELNPDDSEDWEKADIDSIESGLEIIT